MGIKLKGGKEFNAKMKKFAKDATVEAAKANLKTGFRVMTDIREVLTMQAAVDTGMLRASYHLESQGEAGGKSYWQNPGRVGTGTYSGSDGVSHRGWLHAPFTDDTSVIVGSNAPHAAVTEYGRSAGSRMPPPDALEGWARRHGMLAEAETQEQIDSILFSIAASIGAKGFEAKPAFFISVEGNRDDHVRIQTNGLKEAANGVAKR